MQVNQPQNPQEWIKNISKKPPAVPPTSPAEATAPADITASTEDQRRILIKDCFGPSIPPFKFLDANPREVIDQLRTARGPERDSHLLSFQKELDQMSKKELTVARDYLIEKMAEPDNKDDAFLGVLLKVVNRELDSRQNFPGFEPAPPRPPVPRPFPVKPLPDDIFPRKLDNDMRLD